MNEASRNYHPSIAPADLGSVRANAERIREQMVARLEQSPSDFDALHTLGVALFALGSYESANNVLTRAIMRDATQGWTWYWLARNCLAMGDPAAALLAHSRAMEIGPVGGEFLAFEAYLMRIAKGNKGN
jgi:predicted Zn-dependent protease